VIPGTGVDELIRADEVDRREGYFSAAASCPQAAAIS
jgi:hypothetical protein